MRLLSRIVLTISGGACSTFVVAWLEQVSIVRRLSEGEAAPHAIRKVAFIAADVGVLGPVVLVIPSLVAVGALVLEPPRSTTLLEFIVAMRTTQTRVRAAALVPVIFLSAFVATIASAHAARFALGHGETIEGAFTMAIAAVGMTVATMLVGFALVPTLWRVLARFGPGTAATDPVVTGAITLVLIAVLLGVGIATGDSGGGEGLPGIGIFAVLTRPELDLRGVAHALIIACLAYLGGKLTFVASRRRWALAGTAVILIISALCVRAAWALDGEPDVSDLFEQAALGRVALSALRRATDHDGDGYSAHFGGGDCNDHDQRVNPTAIAIPGNGIDEDCSADDAPLPPPAQLTADADPIAPALAAQNQHRPMNVVLFTIDTLRSDLGFAGYPRPVSPNIDKLAAKSTVFEQAYSMASYTAKSMGSLMMGKYASEATRNWDHYTSYSSGNTFFAERLQAAGVQTLAGHCHYYFKWNTGYSRGFSVYDTSAIAPNMADGDGSTTSDRLSDLAIRLLSRPENVTPAGGRRFFAWFHYFDPHAQYVHHDGAPDFQSMPGGPRSRAAYDEEVWFTDKHIGRVLDFIAAQPWGANTAIIITADHGEAFGDAHGVKTHGHELWQSLVRVPLVLFVPEARPRRVKSKRSEIDIAPTVVDLVGAPQPPPGELRGRSLLADVYGEEGKLEERDVYLDMPEGPYNEVRHAMIFGPSPGLKLIHFGGKRYELYNLAKDPEENEDLASDPAVLGPAVERLRLLRSRLKEISVVGPRAGLR